MYERVISWLLSFMGSREHHHVATNQVSVGTTQVQILQRNACRYGVAITNMGSGTVFVGAPGDPLHEMGHALLAGNSLALIGAAEVWGVSDGSGPYLVTYLQEIGS